MNFELQSCDAIAVADWSVDALLWLAPPPSDTESTDPIGAWLLRALAGQAPDSVACLQTHALDGMQARQVVWADVGQATPAQVRKAVQAAMALLKAAPVRRLGVWAPGLTAETCATVLHGVADATYVYTTTKPQAKPRCLESVAVAVATPDALAPAFALAQAGVKGVEFAKEWANRPANHATPRLLAAAAQGLAKKSVLSCEVLGPQEVAALGMGSFMAVAQGSEEPLRFVVLKYQGAPKNVAPVVLVGKGITFDTGGISIKPAAEMDEMKFDMGGAASVLGTFAALAELQPRVNVVGLIPSCENMPSGRAVKPGDVVTSMSGQTIEVLNTDAEGRLILCDALTYAQRFEPRALIDVATLTGACVIALGTWRSGLFANDDALAQRLQDAGRAAQDLCWRMPLDDEYADTLKSNFADMGNVGGRQAGVVTAAKFLQKFVLPHQAWAHLDIAGVAWKGGGAKGSTGRPVPLLLQYLVDEAARIEAEPASPRKKAKKKQAGQ